jgi:hypothetical protein
LACSVVHGCIDCWPAAVRAGILFVVVCGVLGISLFFSLSFQSRNNHQIKFIDDIQNPPNKIKKQKKGKQPVGIGETPERKEKNETRKEKNEERKEKNEKRREKNETRKEKNEKRREKNKKRKEKNEKRKEKNEKRREKNKKRKEKNEKRKEKNEKRKQMRGLLGTGDCICLQSLNNTVHSCGGGEVGVGCISLAFLGLDAAVLAGVDWDGGNESAKAHKPGKDPASTGALELIRIERNGVLVDLQGKKLQYMNE